MSTDRIDQQTHGYRNGHELLASSLHLSREDQDTIDRLSDISGPLSPGETFRPYLTLYPLPGGDHYVVARTWQDLAAPRAGCVLTRSLFLSSSLWERLEQPSSLLSLLTPVEPAKKVAALDVPQGSADALRPISNPRAAELVEAIFLENRQPIVVFDTPELDLEPIVLRLLTAFWPGVRRNFSLCTMALRARKVGSRAFDLQFAPKSARPRFSDWSGRRIDFNNAYTARHRWSLSVADRIFQGKTPSLTTLDTLGVLKNDTRGDESALRLALLWNELSEKAPHTPTAVLGLLDILNSRPDKSLLDLDWLLPQVEQAVDRAAVSMPEYQAWRFLTTLVAKFPNEAPPTSLSAKIRTTAEDLARREPSSAFDFLDDELQNAHTTPPMILAGLAEGTSSTSSEIISSRFGKISPQVGLQLVYLSEAFSRAVLAAAKRMPSHWIGPLVEALQGADGDIRRQLRSQLIPLLDDAKEAPLLAPLLDGVAPHELGEIAVVIGRKTGFAIAEFDEPLGNAARGHDGLQSLRNAVSSQFSSAQADRVLLSTMHLDAQDVSWLCTYIAPERACHLLVRLLEGASDRALIAVQRDTHIRRLIIETLSSNPSVGAGQAARILVLGEIPAEMLLETGDYLLPYLQIPERHKLADLLLCQALAQASPHDSRVARLVEDVKSRPAAKELVRWATAASASTERVAENLVILDSASSEVRFKVVSHVDELSDRLTHRAQADLGDAAYRAWARLIAGVADEGVRFRAASPTLTFALNHPFWAVSPLIVVSFPIVYARLLRSQEHDERTIPAFLALPLSFFIDWDRAKSARRNLVDTYINSNWPPADLLVTSIESGIARETLDRLTRANVGNSYLRAIENDLNRLDEPTRNRVQQSLHQFFS